MLLSIKNVHDAEGEIQKWMWVIFKVPLAIRFYFTHVQSIQGKNIACTYINLDKLKRWVI